MFDGLIVGGLARVIAESVQPENLIEIRLRVGRRLLLLTSKSARVYPRFAGGAYIVTKEDVDGIVARATNMSPYSVSDEMIKGYIPYKSLRIGVGGEGVSEGGKLLNLKNVSYLTIRIPHQIKEAADELIDSVFENAENSANSEVLNTLIISPPAGGKTTILRELARIISAKKNVVVIDERYELACVCDGAPTLDVGDCDVVSGVPKAVAYENCIRAMNPDVIVTDELFRTADVAAICDVLRSGVKVIASVHGDGVEALANAESYADLLKKFDLAVVLSKNPVGQIKEKVRL
ncbi:MAG: Flp pilus assembly complex ATPase component TadA [Bacteroides sp.]|nr:Flp pilus assembly complex ATPase component TadA [Bacillota bacterium]MCM1456009.1 Flp pilus assembly complex ATPase component TadA [Bacteroides sp.]